MLLRPKNLKYQKHQKQLRHVLPRYPTGPVPVPKICYGQYGIYSMESYRITAAQIEACRVSILKTVGRKGLRIWIRIFPHTPITKKALGTRMGKGKGAVDYFAANVKYGKMMFEFNSPSETLAWKAYIQVNHKLPIKTNFTMADKPQQVIKKTKAKL